MRILHILNDVEVVGNGIVHVAVDLSCLQADNGHQVAVASAGGAFVELLEKHDVQHYLCTTKPRSKTFIALRELFRCIRAFRPDVVHCHMVTSLLLLQPLRIWPSKFVVVSHLHNSFSRWAILMSLANRIIAVSKVDAADMERRGMRAAKMIIIPNGTLNSPRSLPAIPSKGRSDKVVITTVAGMYKRKGIIDLLEAFDVTCRSHPNISLFIVGEGPEKQNFEAVAASLHCANKIKFTGFVAEPILYLNETDIFVLASHAEPFGLAILEARSAACAIIATRVGGIPEALDGGEAGILINPSKPDELAAALRTLISNKDLLKKMQHQAINNLEKFSVERVMQDVMKVYHIAIDDRRSLSKR